MKSAEKLIDKIKKEEISPTPKWRFTLKNSLVWAGFILAVIFGALAFSVVLFAIQQTDFEILSHISHSRIELFLGLLPFLWIFTLLIFLIISFYSIQYSKKGYKFTTAKLVAFNTTISILMGTLFFIGGGAEKLEKAFEMNVGLYESVQEKKIKLWSMPEEGYLSGNIDAVTPVYFQLIDFKNKNWTIYFDSAFVAPIVELKKGEKIKIIGEALSDDKFEAKEIRPWGGRRQQWKGKD